MEEGVEEKPEELTEEQKKVLQEKEAERQQAMTEGSSTKPKEEKDTTREQEVEREVRRMQPPVTRYPGNNTETNK